MDINSSINQTFYGINATSSYSANGQFFGKFGVDLAILFLFLLIFVIWTYALIMNNAKKSGRFKYFLPLLFLIILIALWVFAHLYFGTSWWGVFG